MVCRTSPRLLRMPLIGTFTVKSQVSSIMMQALLDAASCHLYLNRPTNPVTITRTVPVPHFRFSFSPSRATPSNSTGLRPSRLSAQAAASQLAARRRHFHVISGRGCRCVSRPVNQDERTSDVRSTSTSQRRILSVLFPPCLCSKGLQKQPRLITTICELRQEVLDELFSVCQYTCLDRFWGSLHRNAHLALRNKYSHIQPFPQ
jgi:hypothetical protein